MRAGQVGRDEMRRVFNLGVGMIAVVARDDVEAAMRAAERTHVAAWLIGEVRAASRKPGASAVRFEER
jgi:phosphoribosylaminoimidazole (AIR) synthetase